MQSCFIIFKFKVENEKNRRAMRRKKEFFKEKSIPELARFMQSELAEEGKNLYHEVKELILRDRKYFFRALIYILGS